MKNKGIMKMTEGFFYVCGGCLNKTSVGEDIYHCPLVERFDINEVHFDTDASACINKGLYNPILQLR